MCILQMAQCLFVYQIQLIININISVENTAVHNIAYIYIFAQKLHRMNKRSSQLSGIVFDFEI